MKRLKAFSRTHDNLGQVPLGFGADSRVAGGGVEGKAIGGSGTAKNKGNWLYWCSRQLYQKEQIQLSQ